MCMARAIFYLTYNGIFNNTNGIGTQTKTFLAGISYHFAALCDEFGELAIHLVGPVYDAGWWGYSPADLAYARKTVAGLGGSLHFCPYRTFDDEFWTPASWLALSMAAAATVLAEAQRYDASLVIANDIPFLHAPLFIERSKSVYGVAVRSLIALYGSSYIHTPAAPDPARLSWERTGLATPASFPDVRIGRFSEFMAAHFVQRYGVDPQHFIPYRSSLALEHGDYLAMSASEVRDILDQNRIPLEGPLILAFGRADWIKGFDLLLHALGSVRKRAHLVLNVVPYSDADPILAEYRSLIDENALSVTLLTGYNRELPRALCQWRNTVAVVCPSRGEPLSNIPFEVSLWARNDGPVLLCSNRDGFREQIEDGRNGFLFDLESTAACGLAAKLDYVLTLPERERQGIRTEAYRRVIGERDFYRNFREMLASTWTD
jgi:glycosyltransferase involved in cell wall biosynthesis